MVLEVEKLHCKILNGFRQDLFATAIKSVLARILMTKPAQQMPDTVDPQFKNAVLSLAA